MKQRWMVAALAMAGLLLVPEGAHGHGGQYKGPGDTVPPGGRPGTGGPGGPGPGTPGGGGPGTPGTLPRGGGPAGGAGGATSPGSSMGPTTDLTEWTFWWEFNKDPILNLKRHIAKGARSTGPEGFFLGHGVRFGEINMRPDETQIRGVVVPALLAALEREDSHQDIVTACLVALAKIGVPADDNGESTFDQLMVRYLPSKVQEVSETATVALGILANPTARTYLRDLLLDNDAGRALVARGEVPYPTRAFAAYGLGLTGARNKGDDLHAEIIRTLVETIESTAKSDRDVQVACLIALGLVAAPNVDPPRGAEEDGVSPAACLTAQLDYLIDFVGDERHHPLVRAHVPTALCRLLDGFGADEEGYLRYKGKIGDLLRERTAPRTREKPEVVQSAVLALGLLGDADDDPRDAAIRAALAKIPADVNDIQARRFALIAMAKAGSRRGEGGDPTDGTKEAAAFLLGQLTKGKAGVRPWAGLALGILGAGLQEAEVAPEVVTNIGTALRESLRGKESPSTMAGIALGAGILGDLGAEERLLELLAETKDEEACGYVALALGLLGDTAAISPIEAVLERSKYAPDLLRQAAIALGLLGDKEVVPRLIGMLESASSLASQAAISSALGFIGDSRSVAPLVALLEKQEVTPLARAFAAVALGIVADKEDLPWNAKISVDLNYRASTVTLTDEQTSNGVLDIL